MARVTFTTFSDASASTNATVFIPASTVYFDGSLNSLFTTTDSTIKIQIYDESTDTLQATPLNTTYSFTANTPVTIETINSSTAPSWVSSSTSGEYYAKLTIGSEYLYVGFKLSEAAPVISGQVIDDSSIDDTGSAVVSWDATNMVSGDVHGAEVNGVFYQGATSDYESFSVTLYGQSLGILDAETITIITANSGGRDTDTSLTITVTEGDTEAVLHVYNLLNANWNAGNVTEPSWVVSGASAGHSSTKDGSLIKIYRSPRPTIRDPKARRSYETRKEFVQISIHSSSTTPRSTMEELKDEVTRVLNSVSTSPGGGYTRLWVEDCEARKESSTHFWAVMDISLDKIYRAVVT